MQVSEILNIIDSFAPPALQEDYDNAGLVTGNPTDELKGILITVDVTEAVIDEAIDLHCNLIISHHPVIFSGLKKLTGSTFVERIIIKALKNDICLYAAHTNLDAVKDGVSFELARSIGLENIKILKPLKGILRKMVTFVPSSHADKVREALFSAGAGHIGNYDCCSYNIEGKGTFRGSDETNPFTGEKGVLSFEDEIRIETVFPKYLSGNVIRALIQSHPYEEVAYDIYPIENAFNQAGFGAIGDLSKAMSEQDYLEQISNHLNIKVIRHSAFLGKKIEKVAVCGGAGIFLLQEAIRAGADLFLTGDIKYHQFFEADNRILLADAGHYETEQFTKKIFFDLITKKLPNFAIYLSKINSNPINYLY